MLEGVTVAESKAQKDELLLTGNDIDMVSQSGVLLKSMFVILLDVILALQLHLSMAHAKSGTKTSENSWMEFTSQRKELCQQIDLVREQYAHYV